MFLKLKQPNGSSVIINTDHVLFFAQAIDQQSNQPVIGQVGAVLSIVGAIVNDQPQQMTVPLATSLDEILLTIAKDSEHLIKL